MTDPIATAGRFTHSRLTDLTDLLGIAVEEHPPPLGSTWPLITYDVQVPNDIRGLGVVRFCTEMEVVVRIISADGALGSIALGDIATAIDSRLVTGTPTVYPDGSTIHACIRLAPYTFTETVDGVTYRHRGGRYRIVASQP